MLKDAHDDLFDTAILVSGDVDLEPAVRMVRNGFKKRLVVFFPPNRVSDRLRKAADKSLDLWHGVLQVCLLPDPVIKADGTKLHCPRFWKRPKRAKSKSKRLPQPLNRFLVGLLRRGILFLNGP